MKIGKVSTRRLSALGATAATAIALVPGSAAAQQQSGQSGYVPQMMGPFMMDWGGWGYGMFFGPLLMILVFGAVVGAAVYVVRALGGAPAWGPPPASPPGRGALDILKERYARGEIEKDEFEERRRVLGD